MALKRRGDGSRVRSGDMRRRLYVKQQTLSEDGQGGRTGTQTTVATVWANIVPLSTARALSYGMVMTNQPSEMDLRWESEDYTLDEDTTLEDVSSGQVYYVHSVVNTDLKNMMAKLVCTTKK